MSTYINTKTGEYPRHIGDIALDPEGTYEPVTWVEPPPITETQGVFLDKPECINGEWVTKWIVRDFTQAEKTARDAGVAEMQARMDAMPTTPPNMSNFPVTEFTNGQA